MQSIMPILLDASLKGLAILLVAVLITAVMRRSSAAARHLVWSGAIVAVLTMPVLSYLLPGLAVLPTPVVSEIAEPTVEMAPQAETAVTASEPPRPEQARVLADRAPSPTTPMDTASPFEPPVPPAVASDRASTSEPRATDAPPARPWWQSWLAWLPWIWLGGAGFALIPLLLGWLSLWQLKRTTQPITGGSWQHLLHDLCARLGLRRKVLLLRSPCRTMPMTWGILAGIVPGVPAQVLIPENADEWSVERRRAVLLHELAHIQRRDCLTQMLTQVACALYWFNPLTWFAAHRMLIERERACDDLVLTHETKASDYAQHLLDIATGPQASFFAAHAGIAVARRSKLDGRLVAILDQHRNRRAMSRLGVVLTITLIGAVAVTVACMQVAEREPASPWVKAELAYYGESIQFVLPQKLTLSDPAQVAELARFFPQLGDPKRAQDPAGWVAVATITFHTADGKAIEVAASPQPDRPEESYWAEDGQGDYLIREAAELVAFVEQLVEAELRSELVGVWQVRPAEGSGNVRTVTFREDGTVLRYEADDDGSGERYFTDTYEITNGTVRLYGLGQKDGRAGAFDVHVYDDVMTMTEGGETFVLDRVAAEAGQGSAGFGPVREQVVADENSGEPWLLDLDRNMLHMQPPAEQADRERIDLSGIKADSGVLIGVGLRAVRLEAPAFEQLSPAELHTTLQHENALPQERGMVRLSSEDTAALPLTYAFQTREGTPGILQVIAYTDDPEGVRLHYKLVQQADAATARAYLEQFIETLKARQFDQAREMIMPTAGVRHEMEEFDNFTDGATWRIAQMAAGPRDAVALTSPLEGRPVVIQLHRREPGGGWIITSLDQWEPARAKDLYERLSADMEPTATPIAGLLGTWRVRESSNTLRFSADGTVQLTYPNDDEVRHGVYQLEGHQLTLELSADAVHNFEIQLRGDVLIVRREGLLVGIADRLDADGGP